MKQQIKQAAEQMIKKLKQANKPQIIKWVILFSSVIVTGIIFSGDILKLFLMTENNADSRIKVGLMTTASGIKDEIAAHLLESLLQEGAFSDKIDFDYAEPYRIEDYEPNLESLVRIGYNLIFCAGAELTEPVFAQAEKNSGVYYVIVDYLHDKELIIPENVLLINLNIYEAVYLTGIIAANTTVSGRLGVIISENTPVQNAVAAAFYAGALTERKDLEISGMYVRSADDAALSESIANHMYSSANDIVFTSSGNADIGVIESAQNKGMYVICNNDALPAVESILAFIEKKYYIIIHDLIQKYIDDEFKGEEMLSFGLKDDFFNIIIPQNGKLPVSENTLNKVESAKLKIMNGSISIPTNENELLKVFPDANFLR